MADRAPSIYPIMRYRECAAAIDWIEEAFGFERHAVHEEDGVVVHAELSFDGDMVMVSQQRDDDARGFGDHVGQEWVYIVVADPDAHYARARAAGAEIVRELEDQAYGSREYSCRDPEGNLWSFGTYRPSPQGEGS